MKIFTLAFIPFTFISLCFSAQIDEKYSILSDTEINLDQPIEMISGTEEFPVSLSDDQFDIIKDTNIDTTSPKTILSPAEVQFIRPDSNSQTEKPVLELELENVIKDVVFYNPSVEEMRLEWLSSCQKIKAAWGVYEPDLVGSFENNSSRKENTAIETLQQGGGSVYSADNNIYKLGIEGKMFTGTTYNLGYSLTDTKSNLTARKEYITFAGLTVTQPLLKGVWFGASMADLKVARLERSIAFNSFRAKLMSAVYEAESSYWNLYFAEEKNRVASESVEIAKKLVDDSKARFKTGKMSQLDLFEAEAGLSSRLANQSDAKQDLLDAVNKLKLLLSNHKFDEDVTIHTKTTMVIPDEKPGDSLINSRINDALSVQPNYLLKRYGLDKGDVVVDYQKSQILPEVNVNGSYGYNGYGFDANQSWHKIEAKKQDVWSVACQIRVPLCMGSEERHLLKTAKLKRQAAKEDLKAVEYEIISTLYSLDQRISSLRERIKNAQTVVDYRTRLLEVEFSRLEAGKSNTRVIYDTEEKLTQAKMGKLESIVRFKEAVLQFALVSGSLLRDKGLERIENGKPALSENILRPR